jgi:hypothetical protein
MYLLYGFLIVLSIVIIGGAICGVFRVGEKENICNYRYIEEDKKQ